MHPNSVEEAVKPGKMMWTGKTNGSSPMENRRSWHPGCRRTRQRTTCSRTGGRAVPNPSMREGGKAVHGKMENPMNAIALGDDYSTTMM